MVFSAASRAELVKVARATSELLRREPEIPLASLAYAQCLCKAGEVRLAIVACSNEDLTKKLEFAIDQGCYLTMAQLTFLPFFQRGLAVSKHVGGPVPVPAQDRALV